MQKEPESASALVAALYADDPSPTANGGLSTRNNLRAIEELALSYSPRSTLEIGLGPGGSAVLLAAIHRNQNLHGKHVAIDPYQSSPTAFNGRGRSKLEQAGLLEFVEIIEEKSCIVLPRLLAEGRRFGLIYIDGSHIFEDVFVDAYFAVRLLGPSGYILFDDSSNPHVAKVLSFIDSTQAGLERKPEKTLRQKIARLIGKRQLTIYQLVGVSDRPWDAPFRKF